MFEMKEEYCNSYKIKNGRAICLINSGGVPNDCESCPYLKKHPYQEKRVEDKDIFTVLEYRSLKKAAGISFSMRKGGSGYAIHISKSCRDALGDPEYVAFSLSGDKKRLKIEAVGKDAANAVRVSQNIRGADIYSAYIARQIEPYGDYGVGQQPQSGLHSVIFNFGKR